jgi:hypothetical protein
MRIILDSGLLYTVCVIIFFGTTLAGSNAQYGVSDVVVQVIGITFNLIIIRVHNGSAPESNFTSSTIEIPRFVHNTTLDPHTLTTPAEINVGIQVTQQADDDSVYAPSHKAWKHESLPK